MFKKGQVSIEILAILGVVVLGSIIAGVYYINSVNENINQSNDLSDLTNSFDDAFSELTDPNSGGYINPNTDPDGGDTDPDTTLCPNGSCGLGENYSVCPQDCFASYSNLKGIVNESSAQINVPFNVSLKAVANFASNSDRVEVSSIQFKKNIPGLDYVSTNKCRFSDLANASSYSAEEINTLIDEDIDPNDEFYNKNLEFTCSEEGDYRIIVNGSFSDVNSFDAQNINTGLRYFDKSIVLDAPMTVTILSPTQDQVFKNTENINLSAIVEGNESDDLYCTWYAKYSSTPAGGIPAYLEEQKLKEDAFYFSGFTSESEASTYYSDWGFLSTGPCDSSLSESITKFDTNYGVYDLKVVAYDSTTQESVTSETVNFIYKDPNSDWILSFNPDQQIVGAYSYLDIRYIGDESDYSKLKLKINSIPSNVDFFFYNFPLGNLDDVVDNYNTGNSNLSSKDNLDTFYFASSAGAIDTSEISDDFEIGSETVTYSSVNENHFYFLLYTNSVGNYVFDLSVSDNSGSDFIDLNPNYNYSAVSPLDVSVTYRNIDIGGNIIPGNSNYTGNNTLSEKESLDTFYFAGNDTPENPGVGTIDTIIDLVKGVPISIIPQVTGGGHTQTCNWSIDGVLLKSGDCEDFFNYSYKEGVEYKMLRLDVIDDNPNVDNEFYIIKLNMVDVFDFSEMSVEYNNSLVLKSNNLYNFTEYIYFNANLRSVQNSTGDVFEYDLEDEGSCVWKINGQNLETSSCDFKISYDELENLLGVDKSENSSFDVDFTFTPQGQTDNIVGSQNYYIGECTLLDSSCPYNGVCLFNENNSGVVLNDFDDLEFYLKDDVNPSEKLGVITGDCYWNIPNSNQSDDFLNQNSENPFIVGYDYDSYSFVNKTIESAFTSPLGGGRFSYGNQNYVGGHFKPDGTSYTAPFLMSMSSDSSVSMPTQFFNTQGGFPSFSNSAFTNLSTGGLISDYVLSTFVNTNDDYGVSVQDIPLDYKSYDLKYNFVNNLIYDDLPNGSYLASFGSVGNDEARFICQDCGSNFSDLGVGENCGLLASGSSVLDLPPIDNPMYANLDLVGLVVPAYFSCDGKRTIVLYASTLSKNTDFEMDDFDWFMHLDDAAFSYDFYDYDFPSIYSGDEDLYIAGYRYHLQTHVPEFYVYYTEDSGATWYFNSVLVDDVLPLYARGNTLLLDADGVLHYSFVASNFDYDSENNIYKKSNLFGSYPSEFTFNKSEEQFVYKSLASTPANSYRPVDVSGVNFNRYYHNSLVPDSEVLSNLDPYVFLNSVASQQAINLENGWMAQIWMSWYSAFMDESGPDNVIVSVCDDDDCSRLPSYNRRLNIIFSNDNGRTWTNPIVLLDSVPESLNDSFRLLTFGDDKRFSLPNMGLNIIDLGDGVGKIDLVFVNYEPGSNTPSLQRFNRFSLNVNFEDVELVNDKIKTLSFLDSYSGDIYKDMISYNSFIANIENLPAVCNNLTAVDYNPSYNCEYNWEIGYQKIDSSIGSYRRYLYFRPTRSLMGGGSYWAGGDGFCFSGDTNVLTNKGNKQIKDILAGDVVYSYDSGKLVETVVDKLWVHDNFVYDGSFDYLNVTLENSVVLQVASNHSLYDPILESYKQLYYFNVGDSVLYFNSDLDAFENVLIKDISKVSDFGVLYNLSLAEPHNYFADGVLAHNATKYPPIDHTGMVIDSHLGQTLGDYFPNGYPSFPLGGSTGGSAQSTGWNTTNYYGASGNLIGYSGVYVEPGVGTWSYIVWDDYVTYGDGGP